MNCFFLVKSESILIFSTKCPYFCSFWFPKSWSCDLWYPKWAYMTCLFIVMLRSRIKFFTFKRFFLFLFWANWIISKFIYQKGRVNHWSFAFAKSKYIVNKCECFRCPPKQFNCNYIYSPSLPEDSEGTLSVFESSCHLFTTRGEASHCLFLLLNVKQRNCELNSWFDSSWNRYRVYGFCSRTFIQSNTDR